MSKAAVVTTRDSVGAFEALGFAGPDVDAEMILMVRALWRELGLVVRVDRGAQTGGACCAGSAGDFIRYGCSDCCCATSHRECCRN